MYCFFKRKKKNKNKNKSLKEKRKRKYKTTVFLMVMVECKVQPCTLNELKECLLTESQSGQTENLCSLMLPDGRLAMELVLVSNTKI